MSGNKKVKKFIGVTGTLLGTAFAGLKLCAKKQEGKSVYSDEPSEKNPMEGKKVVFVQDDNDCENADGVRGHLEAVGNSDYNPCFYEKYVKRALDVVLSFGGLVILSPIFIGLLRNFQFIPSINLRPSSKSWFYIICSIFISLCC